MTTEPIIVAFQAAKDFTALKAYGFDKARARQIVADAAKGDPDAKHLIDKAHGRSSFAPDAIVPFVMFGRLP